MRRLLLTTLAGFVLAAAPAAQEGMPASKVINPRQMAAAMEDKIGTQVDTSLAFTDERGLPFRLQQLFPGDKPVLLVPGYYSCPNMCGTVLQELVKTLNQVALEPGKDYLLLNVTIDPRETPEQAKARKTTFAQQLAKVGVEDGWHFLTGADATIRALMGQVGFHYIWDEHDNRYDHSPALIFLTPEGRVNHVIASSNFDPDSVRLAIVDASKGRIGSFWDKVQLTCLTWDPTNNIYSLTAMTLMRIGGVVTLLALALMIVIMVRKERRRPAPASA